MRKFKKGFAVLTTAALAASMLIPATVMNQTAKADKVVTQVAMNYSAEEMYVKGAEDISKVYVSVVKNGKESTPEIYDVFHWGYEEEEDVNAAIVDLSPFLAKGAELKVYTDKDKTNKVSVKIPAQASKVKAVVNPKTNGIDVTIDGTAVPYDKVQWRKSTGSTMPGNGKLVDGKLTSASVSQFYTKGTTLYVSRIASNPAVTSNDNTAWQTAVAEADGYFASKEVKVKIKAAAKAPTVKLDAVKGTLTFPKGVQYQVTQGWLLNDDYTAVDQAEGVSVWSKAYDAKKVISIDEFMAKVTSTALITSTEGITISDEHFNNASNAAVVEVRTAATDKKVESKVGEIEIPWQKVIASTTAITKGNVEVTFDYKDLKKTKTTDEVKNYESVGLTIKNASTTAIQYAIADSTDATKIEANAWKTMKNNAAKKFKIAKLPEGKYIAIRTLGVNDNKKTTDKNELALPSNVVFSDKVDYPDKVASDLSVTWKAYSKPGTSSGASLTVGATSDGYKYSYQVVDKAIAGYSIGTKAPAGKELTGGTEANVDVKTDQYVIVYAEKDGVVVKYSCAKASNIS